MHADVEGQAHRVAQTFKQLQSKLKLLNDNYGEIWFALSLIFVAL